MAAKGWGTDRSIAEFLYESGHRFNFYQAVKILEIMDPEKNSVGIEPDPSKEAVRFKSRVALDFPAGDVDAIEEPAGEKVSRMTVNFMGMAGANSPLPASYAELAIERAWKKDPALKNFLDIFNHRLISLMYRIRKKYHIGFDFKPPYDDNISSFLFALIGLETPGLRRRMQVKDRALLFYVGLFNQQPHSMIGLESILSHYFQTPVRGIPYRGQWLRIEPDQQTHIGARGQNQILGESALLGTRVWDVQSSFRLHLGPLSIEQFMDQLPIGRAFIPMCQLTRFYFGAELTFDFKLQLKAADVPESRLSGGNEGNGPRLGWTSWLKTKEFTGDDEQVTLRLDSGEFLSRHFEASSS